MYFKLSWKIIKIFLKPWGGGPAERVWACGPPREGLHIWGLWLDSVVEGHRKWGKMTGGLSIRHAPTRLSKEPARTPRSPDALQPRKCSQGIALRKNIGRCKINPF